MQHAASASARCVSPRRGAGWGAYKQGTAERPSPPPAQLRCRRRPRRFRRSRRARHRRHTVRLSLPAAERAGGAVSGSMVPGQRHCCAARLGGVAAPRLGCGRCCGASGDDGRFAPSPLTAATSASPSRGGSPTAAPPQRRGRRPATEAEGATAAKKRCPSVASWDTRGRAPLSSLPLFFFHINNPPSRATGGHRDLG